MPERDNLPRSAADEEILASGDAVPPEILEPSAASIVAARREAHAHADGATTQGTERHDRDDEEQAAR